LPHSTAAQEAKNLRYRNRNQATHTTQSYRRQCRFLLPQLAERFFALLPEKQIRRGIHRSTRQLEQAIRHYLDTYNATAKPFVWTKTAEQILASVARFCQRTSVTGH
jgi:hypothetical protein